MYVCWFQSDFHIRSFTSKTTGTTSAAVTASFPERMCLLPFLVDFIFLHLSFSVYFFAEFVCLFSPISFHLCIVCPFLLTVSGQLLCISKPFVSIMQDPQGKQTFRTFRRVKKLLFCRNVIFDALSHKLDALNCQFNYVDSFDISILYVHPHKLIAEYCF